MQAPVTARPQPNQSSASKQCCHAHDASRSCGTHANICHVMQRCIASLDPAHPVCQCVTAETCDELCLSAPASSALAAGICLFAPHCFPSLGYIGGAKGVASEILERASQCLDPDLGVQTACVHAITFNADMSACHITNNTSLPYGQGREQGPGRA